MRIVAQLARVLALAAAVGASSGCRDSSASSSETSASTPAATAEVKDVVLPGVDTSAMTPRERHAWSALVGTLFAPCPDVPVSVAQCVLESRACGSCVRAAKWVAHAVRDGASDTQIQHAYKERFNPASVKTLPLDGSPTKGPDDAPVTIFEFADFECPHCAMAVPALDAVMAAHPGKVRLVYKSYTLPFHAHGEPAAKAAFAAGAQGRFWEMEHLLFERQQHLEDADLERYAGMLKLDIGKWKSDMDSASVKSRLSDDHKLGEDLKLKGTPTIYVNGRELDVEEDETIEDRVANELGVPAAPQPSGEASGAAEPPPCPDDFARRSDGRSRRPPAVTTMALGAIGRRARARIANLASFVALVSLVGLAAPAGCQGGGANDPSQVTQDVELPGVDTHEFTPREKHEFSTYVGQFAAPCSAVAVPVGQCVLEKRACAACLPAARTIAKAVREGMARDQIEGIYKERFDAASAKAIPVDGSPTRGPATAPVTIVEFADFECPFCQRIAPELDALWEQRQTAVRFVYKFMPLAMHQHGEPAARAAIAAQAQGKFWEMHHLLFTNGDRLDDASILGYATTLGLDLDKFRADMQSPATKARIEADRKLGDALNVKGTPTLYINGREYDSKIDLGEWVDGEIAAATPAH